MVFPHSLFDQTSFTFSYFNTAVFSVIFALFKQDGFEKEFWLKLSVLDLLIFIFIAIYSYESISNNLNIGLRHFMPVVFAVSALTARGTVVFWNDKILKK